MDFWYVSELLTHVIRSLHFRQIHKVLGMPMEDEDYSKGPQQHHGGAEQNKNGSARKTGSDQDLPEKSKNGSSA